MNPKHRSSLVIALLSLAAAAQAATADVPPATLNAPAARVLQGFDGLRFGMTRQQVVASLNQRDSLRFEVVRMVAGDEIRYRTAIGDLPFDVFLQFEPQGTWKRATIQLVGYTFGQAPRQCAALFDRVLYLVSLQHGPPDERSAPLGAGVLDQFTQRAEFRFANSANLAVHNRHDATTCYNYVVIEGTPQRPVPSTF